MQFNTVNRNPSTHTAASFRPADPAATAARAIKADPPAAPTTTRAILLDAQDAALQNAAAEAAASFGLTLIEADVHAKADSRVPTVLLACVSEITTASQLRPGLPWPPLAAPVVAVASADSGLAVEAMRLGAYDFVAMPVSPEALRRTLRTAVEEGVRRHGYRKRIEEFSRQIKTLSDNERTVLNAVCNGKLNKQIAREMNVSVRTIEQRRRRVFDKMQVLSAVPLARRMAEVETLQQLCAAPASHRMDSTQQHGPL